MDDGFFRCSKKIKFVFILLISFLFINSLNADSLLELLSSHSQTSNFSESKFFTADENYSDYYYLSKDNGEKQYLNSNILQLGYGSPLKKKHYLNISIDRRETNFFINNLNSINDRVKFYSGSSQIKLGLRKRSESHSMQIGCSFNRIITKLKYNFTDEGIVKSGHIPLAIDKLNAEFRIKFPEFVILIIQV